MTTNTKSRYPYFKDETLCTLFIEELTVVKQLKKFLLFGFCIMPDHVHLLVKPLEKYNLSQIMKSLKENFSRDVNKLLQQNGDHRPVSEGDTSTCRLLIREFITDNKFKTFSLPKFQWQKSYHDHYIRNNKDFNARLNYINTNHLKHNLSHNYKYIGYNYIHLLDII